MKSIEIVALVVIVILFLITTHCQSELLRNDYTVSLGILLLAGAIMIVHHVQFVRLQNPGTWQLDFQPDSQDAAQQAQQKHQQRTVLLATLTITGITLVYVGWNQWL